MTTDAAEVLDIPYLACGYNVRGLDRTVRCPECGTEIQLSYLRQAEEQRNPYSLQAGSRRWLRRVRVGFWLIFAGAVAQIATSAIKHVASVKNWDSTIAIMVPVQLVSMGSILSLIAGVVLTLSRRDVPSRPLRWARWGLCIAAWLTLGWLALILAASFAGKWALVRSIVVGFAILGSILSLGGWLYWSVYFGRSRLRRWMWVIAGLMLFASFAPQCVDIVPVAASHYYSTLGMPVVGCVDALFIVGRSLVYQPRVDVALIVYAISGLASAASVVTLAVAARRVGKATAEFRDLH